MSGELEVESCRCLENFWDLRVAGHRHVRVHLEDVDAVDAHGVAVFIGRVEQALRSGSKVVLVSPPQLVAHSLYKCGLLAPASGLTLEDLRQEEPYLG